MTNSLSCEQWALRAAACELMALSFRYPTADLAAAVTAGEWAEAAEEVAEALELDLPEGFGSDARSLLESGDDEALRVLRAEATRLFVGAPTPQISPYESTWRAADAGVHSLHFVNPWSTSVERFCRSCGLGRPEGTNEPLDHAATELELLQLLAMMEAGHLSFDERPVGREDLPGGSPAAAYDAFFSDRILSWMDRFAGRVAEETEVPFYRAAAVFLAAFLGADR